MPGPKRTLTLEHLVTLAWQKRHGILLPMIGALILGLALALYLPKVYEAQTLILVEPQRVPGEFVRSIVTQDIRHRIGTISQQILSRSNLERVIDKFQLFSEPAHAAMYMEDKLEALRKRISVKVSQAHGGADAFSIVHWGPDPETVMKVADTLSSLFIEANLEIREEQAEGTSVFINEELENLRSQLGWIESDLQSYRMRHMGELPEQLESNLRFLETFRVQIEERKERLKNERYRLVMADNEIEQLKLNLARERSLRMPAAPNSPAEAPIRPDGVERLHDELAALRSRYTEQHPSVVQLRKRVEDAERQAPLPASKPVMRATPEVPSKTSVATPLSDRILSERIHQRELILSSIQGLQEDIARLDRQIQEYQGRIERTPKREEELLSLKRDHDNMQAAYKSLLSRKIEADMAVNMERKKKGEQFRVLDAAKLPEKPVSPNLIKIFILTLCGGLGSGLAFVVAADLTAGTVRRKTDLDYVGLPVLAALPLCRTQRIARRQKANAAATFGLIATASTLTLLFAFLVWKG
jgi:polysaccharide chain length determinant protein (PEP-CTERM system associated)